MSELMVSLAQFHFIRPQFLWLLLVLPVIAWLLRKTINTANNWQRYISATLLRHLTSASGVNSPKKSNSSWLIILVALITLAAAGPTWKQKSQEIHQINDSLVIVLDLSISMLANDTAPSRLVRTKQKLQDLLTKRKEGNTALIAFSGDSHVVTPLTDDIQTISANLPALDPFLMPVVGARPDLAIAQAIDLLDQANISQGRIIMLTDGVSSAQAERITDALASTPHSLSILAAGTSEGGPIPIPERGYLKDQGTVVIPKTDFAQLAALASASNGQMYAMSLDERDLDAIDASGALRIKNVEAKQQKQSALFDQWEDMGYLLMLLILPLSLFAYRQGAVLLVVLFLSFPHEQAEAFDWRDLWQTKDQQGQAAFDAGDAKTAAELFQSPPHKAQSFYQTGDYENAEKLYADALANKALTNPDLIYNLANTQAKLGKYEDALTNYEKALGEDPNHEDAAHNKAIVEQLLNQQQQQDGENGENADNESTDQQSQSQQDSDQKQGENQNNDNAESQNSDQQNPEQSEQQNSDPNQEQQDANQNSQGNDSEQESEDASSQAQQAEASEQNEEQESQYAEQVAPELDALSDEEQQSYEQWMRRVPDDPSGLLRRKFEYQARERSRTENEAGEPLW
jgi:Ca-activated chloride channel family protein